MNSLIKAAIFASATALALVLYFFTSFSTNNSGYGPLNSTQIISGVLLLLIAILVPAWRNSQKSEVNK